MEVLLPTIPLDSSALSECREEIDLDDFFLAKLAYINSSSDLDVFQLQGNERIKHLICAWDTAYVLCRRCDAERQPLPDFLQNFLVNLVHYSMSMWFSLEWEKCDFNLCCSLLVSMFRIRPRLIDIPCLEKLNWKHVMSIGVRPWQGTYFKEYMRALGTCENSASSAAPLTFSVETVELPATIYDIAHLNEEGLVITLLRLMKLFDAGCMESVKRFSICAISAWNQEQQKYSELNLGSCQVYDPEVKRCLNMIAHTHLMAVFEKDTAVGFEIDNMINNIRFYHKCITDARARGKPLHCDVQECHITPSRLFAITCVRLNQSVQDFIESVVPDLSRESCNTLFGAVSHAYATYLLASILVDMNKFNKGDFIANVEKYKNTMRAYVVERERSERFILEEVNKQKLQSTSHNVTCTVKEITKNFKTAIGKGNHSSNLVNHKPTDVQSQQERAELFETENEKRYDPVFQTMPNNEIVTNEFYDLLSRTKYKGWHFAKLVLLLKIIERELNDIEKWCYHPGLTTQFMMSLEERLAKHFEDLALIFQDHIFMEQEFWLTAFFLRPVRSYYDKVTYCGTRFFRTVNLLNKGDRDEVILKPTDKNDEVSCAFLNAKYGLLSSTFDVKQIAQMTCVDTAESDYNSLAKALRTLRLPESIIKDLLTVTFSPRHANFTWAAEWSILRKRCKMLITNPQYKRELVESNMAEANDRLKYLKVDFDKYKSWPQLDYGSIEEGYEKDYIGDEMDDSDDDEDEIEEDVKKKKGRPPGQAKEKRFAEFELNEAREVESQTQETLTLIEADISNGLKRSSARRAAAVIASAMLKEDYNMKTLKKKDDQQKQNLTTVESEQQANSSDMKILESTNEMNTETLRYTNSTGGFISVINIWDYQKQNRNLELLEQESLQTTSNIFRKVGDLYRKINNENENESYESSSSDDSDDDDDDDSINAHSMHDAMNVSDSETSNSFEERSQECWENMLPSFIVANKTQNQLNASTDKPIVLTTNEAANTASKSVTEKELSVNEAEASTKTTTTDNSRSSHIIIQSVEIFPAPLVVTSSDAILKEKSKAELVADVSIATADSTDTLLKNNAVAAENSKDEEISMEITTTTIATTTTTTKEAEKEETIDSTACLKTVDPKLVDEPSIENNNRELPIKNIEPEKVEAHSTQIGSQLTGKPKSFSAILAAQLLSEDSLSQSSNGTHPHDSNSCEFNESDAEEKRKAELIQLCLKKKCYVPIQRIHWSPPPKLRELLVRIKRLNIDKYLKEKEKEKALREKRRTQTKPKLFYMEEENASPVEKTTTKLRKRRNLSPLYSDSESDEDYNPEQAKETLRPKNRKLLKVKKTSLPVKCNRNRAKSFSVVPRSASGLKVCISSLCKISSPTEDCIEISSSSDSDVVEVASYPVTFVSGLVADEDDPLFEEEADIELLY